MQVRLSELMGKNIHLLLLQLVVPVVLGLFSV